MHWSNNLFTFNPHRSNMSHKTLQEQILDHISTQQWKLVKATLSLETYWEEVTNAPMILPGTLLHIACSSPSVPEDVISALLHAYPEAVSIEDEDGNLPIHLLCEFAIRPDIVKLLLIACPESSFKPSHQQQELPFYILIKHCIQNYGLQVAFDLISSLPSSLIYNQEVSVLHQICNDLLPESICHKVIEQFPHICKLYKDGNSLLHTMCSHKDSSSNLIERIISICPESCAVRDENGNIPLHLVNSQRHSLEIIRMLVKCYPQGILVQNSSGQIPLVSPMIRNSPKRVKELLRFCSENDSIRNSILYTRNRFGMDPIRDYLYALQRQVSDLVAQGMISIDDLSSYGRMKNYTKLIANNLESLFHIMSLAANNDVDSSLNTPHQEPFWTAFPIFVKTLLHHSPELACRQDCVGNLPLHVIAGHNFRGLHSMQCSFCSSRIRGPYLWFQSHTYACKDCSKIDDSSSRCFANSYPPLIEYQGCELMKDVIAANPSAALVRDAAGNFPLHLSLKSGKTWCTGVSELTEVAPSALTVLDGETNMFPFMLAAEGKQYDAAFSKGQKLTTIYGLLRADPSQIR